MCGALRDVCFPIADITLTDARPLPLRSFRLRRDNRWTYPILRNEFHNQYAARLLCLVLSGMREVPRFEIIVSSLIDSGVATLSECELAGKNIPNPGPNVMMHSEIGAWSERKFGGAHFVLTVKLNQVAEGNLLEFDLRR